MDSNITANMEGIISLSVKKIVFKDAISTDN